jgi:small multidrug resistance pump
MTTPLADDRHFFYASRFYAAFTEYVLMSPVVLLLIAILAEIIGTSALRLSEGFTRLVPSIVVVAGYVATFYLMSLVLKSIPIGTVYATWSGLGTLGIVLVGVIVWHEPMDWPKIIGIAFIIVGVVLLNFVSGSSHG